MLVAFDTETSGLKPSKHGILSLACVAFDSEFNVLKEYYSLVKLREGAEVDAKAIEINKLDPTKGKEPEIVANEMLELFGTGNIPVCHYATFDMGMIAGTPFEQVFNPREAVCTRGHAKTMSLDPQHKGKFPSNMSLKTLVDHFQIPLYQSPDPDCEAHHALYDAHMCMRLLKTLWSLK